MSKKKNGFREAVGAQFVSFFQFYSIYFNYACSVGDALSFSTQGMEGDKIQLINGHIHPLHMGWSKW